jgi:hypothetical protein
MAKRKFILWLILKMKVVSISLIAIIFVKVQMMNLFHIDG